MSNGACGSGADSCQPFISGWGKAGEHLRVVTWALVMGPLVSGGVCSMGPYLVHGIDWVCIGVQIKGPYQGTIGSTLESKAGEQGSKPEGARHEVASSAGDP